MTKRRDDLEVEAIHNLGTIEELGIDPDLAREIVGKLIAEGRLDPTISTRAATSSDPATILPVRVAHDAEHDAAREAAAERGHPWAPLGKHGKT